MLLSPTSKEYAKIILKFYQIISKDSRNNLQLRPPITQGGRLPLLRQNLSEFEISGMPGEQYIETEQIPLFQQANNIYRQSIPAYIRLEIIYEQFVHNMRPSHIARKLSLNTSTIKNILDAFKKSGQIFALQTLKSKRLNLKSKEESLKRQAKYRQYRRSI